MKNPHSGQRRLFWLVVAFVVVTVLCLLAPEVEHDAQRALRQSERDSQELAEVWRNYYGGRPDHVSPSD